MSKKTIKVGKKKDSGYLTNELGGTLGDIMSVENNDTVEEIFEEDTDYDTVDNGDVDAIDDKEKQVVVEIVKNKKDKNESTTLLDIMNDDVNIKIEDIAIGENVVENDKSVISDKIHNLIEKLGLPKTLTYMVKNVDYIEFKQLIEDNLCDDGIMSYFKNLSLSIKNSTAENIDVTVKANMVTILKMLSDDIHNKVTNKISSKDFKQYQDIILDTNYKLLNCADNIDILMKEFELDKEVITVLSYYRKSVKQVSNTLLYGFSKELKDNMVDPFLGQNKTDLIINLLKEIKISKPKSSKPVEDNNNVKLETPNLSEVKLEITAKEFIDLLANAKYNDCRENVKSLSYVLKNLNDVDIKTLVSTLEEKVMFYLDELADKDFIAPSLLDMAVDITSNKYIKEAKLISTTIKNAVDASRDKHIISILTFVDAKLIKPILKHIKDIIIDFRKRDILTIDNYMSAFKIDINIYDKIIKPTESIIKLLPGDIKCKLNVPSELALVGIDEDDILMQYIITDMLITDILVDDYLEDNIDVYPALKEYAESIVPDNKPETSLVDIVKDNKTKVIKHLQMQIISSL